MGAAEPRGRGRASRGGADRGRGKCPFPTGNSRSVPMRFHNGHNSAAFKSFGEDTLLRSGDGRKGVAKPSQVPIGDGRAGYSGSGRQMKDEIADGGRTNESAPSDGGRRGRGMERSPKALPRTKRVPTTQGCKHVPECGRSGGPARGPGRGDELAGTGPSERVPDGAASGHWSRRPCSAATDGGRSHRESVSS